MSTSAADAVAFMKRNALVLATAESCTSGLIASQLADVPGAGSCLDRAFVTYSVAAKLSMLGVSQATIDRYNLTSEQVVREMALGAMQRSRANVVIANTGVVDDTDGAIAAGTQFLCWAFRRPGGRHQLFVERCRFLGGRRSIREQCAAHALARLGHYYRSA